MKNKFLYKLTVYGASLLLVGGAAAGFFLVKDRMTDSHTPAETASTIAEEALPEAKPVMTQDEMEALFDEHRQEYGAAPEEGAFGEALPEMDGEQPAETGTAGTEVSEEAYVSPVDFEGMWEINQDVYAWITIPGTVIDYPVLQHTTDNSYYLNYNIDGSYGYPGCIYTESMNARDFTDNNTVIYGHNMKNGTMFSDLHKFEDASFLEENDQIMIYMPDQELSYTIFAAYVYDDRHLLYSFNFGDKGVYASYLETVQGIRDMNAVIRDDVAVTADDRIITLVTCIADQPEKRLLVQAVWNKGE